MYKQSSGRNNRSKGLKIKIKHVIQLFVLMAICLWLIYQVKHSHDKKREFEEKNIKTPSSLSNGAGDEVIKFGRKDVQTRFEKTTLVTDGKVEEAEGGVQEDNTNDEDEQEEDIKHEEKEDEGRGGGDDEIDENNQHKFDMELEREGIDEKDAEGKDTEEEEVERSEGENSEELERSEGENSEEVERSRRENSEEVERSRRENSEEGQTERENSEEGQTERENSGEGQREREEEDHEAREEHYKADDASSAVAHQTENESLEKLNERSPTEEESSNNVEEVKAGRQNSAQGNQTVGNDILQNDVTANGRSSLNSTTEGIGLKEGNDLIEMGIETSGGDAKNLQQKSASYTSPISSDLKAMNNFTTQLEEGEKTQETSQTIVHESASKGNTTTGAELDHSEAVVEGDAAAGETNKSGSELESGKEDPNSDSSLSDPIDSLDSSSSHLESSSSVHDHVGEDTIIRTMEGSSNDTTTTK